MSRVIPLVIFGFTLIIGGLYWNLWDGSREYLNNIIIEDSYYILMRYAWAWIPAILIFIGIICLILAGISKTREKVVEY